MNLLLKRFEKAKLVVKLGSETIEKIQEKYSRK